MTTNGTLFSRLLKSRVKVILFTIHFTMDVVECFTPQCSSTATADETAGMVQISHSLASLISSKNLFGTSQANSIVITTLVTILKFILYFFHEQFYLLLCFRWSLCFGRCYRVGKKAWLHTTTWSTNCSKGARLRWWGWRFLVFVQVLIDWWQWRWFGWNLLHALLTTLHWCSFCRHVITYSCGGNSHRWGHPMTTWLLLNWNLRHLGLLKKGNVEGRGRKRWRNTLLTQQRWQWEKPSMGKAERMGRKKL